MAIMLSLCEIAMKQWAGDGGEKAVRLLADHFSDHSQGLVRALGTANERAWKTFELALAGDSWWDRMRGVLARGEDKALALQVRTFLEAHPMTEFVSQPRVRELCLRDLHAARAAGHLEGDIDRAVLAQKLRTGQHLADPARRMKEDLDAVGRIASFLRQQDYQHLAWLLEVQIAEGRSLLVVAVRYYFRREIETNGELFQGLTFLRLEDLAEGQQRGFEELSDLLTKQSGWFDASLQQTRAAVVAATGARQAAEAGQREVQRLREDLRSSADVQRTAVLDLKAELQRTVAGLGQQYEAQFQKVYQPLIQMLERLQLQNRPVRPSDSMSIRNDRERKQAEELLQNYRAIPAEKRRDRPALVNGLGQLEFAINDFDGAQATFTEAAAMAPDTASRAEAFHNAYRAALERTPRRFEEALRWLRQALELDAERFAPFPVHDYEPLRILGAGGFGVTFLCRHRLSGGEVAIKALSADGLDRDVHTVFQEANALERLNHPAIIRLRDCNFADRARTSRPFLIMDYFPGQTLEAFVAERGPIPFDELLPLACEVVEALQAAHRANLLHRDVKPANLLVRRQAPPNRTWQIRLIDFGLALRQDMLTKNGSSQLQRGNSTIGSAIAGTLDYAAPEQLGKLPGVPVGPAADMYGFAKLCSYALFQTPEPTYLDWLKVPRGAAELFGKCLARMPDQRPASFAVIQRQLETLRVPEVIPVQHHTRKIDRDKGPPPLPVLAVPVVVPVVKAVKPAAPSTTMAQVRFFMAPLTGLEGLAKQPRLKIFLNGKCLGESPARSGFQLRFEAPPGMHALEVVCWQDSERGRKEFVLDVSRPGGYEIRFNSAGLDSKQSLFAGKGNVLAKCSIEVLKEP